MKTSKIFTRTEIALIVIILIILLTLGVRSKLFYHTSFFLLGVYFILRGIRNVINFYAKNKQGGADNSIHINRSIIVIAILFFIGSHMCVKSLDIIFSNTHIVFSQLWNVHLKIVGHLTLLSHITITTALAFLIHFVSVELVNKYYD